MLKNLNSYCIFAERNSFWTWPPFPIVPSLTRLHRLHFHLLWSRNETKGLMYVLQDRHLTIVLDVTTGSCYKRQPQGKKKTDITWRSTYFSTARKEKMTFKRFFCGCESYAMFVCQLPELAAHAINKSKFILTHSTWRFSNLALNIKKQFPSQSVKVW